MLDFSLDSLKQQIDVISGALSQKKVKCVFVSSSFIENDTYFNKHFSDLDFLVVVPDKDYTLDNVHEIENALKGVFKYPVTMQVHVYPQDYLFSQLSEGEPILSSLVKNGKIIYSSDCQEALLKKSIRVTSKTISGELNYCITKLGDIINHLLKQTTRDAVKSAYRMSKYALYALFISEYKELPSDIAQVLQKFLSHKYGSLVSTFNNVVQLRYLISEQIENGESIKISLGDLKNTSKNYAVNIITESYLILSEVIKIIDGKKLIPLKRLVDMLLEKEPSEVSGTYNFLEKVPYLLIWSKFGYEKEPLCES